MRGWTILCAAGAALLWLCLFPSSRRERRLRRRGRSVTAICLAHLNPATGDGPIRVRCGYRPDPQGAEYRVVVRTHEHIPQVGDELLITYDPKNPHHAENQDLLDTWWYGYGDLILPLTLLGGLLLAGGCAAAMSS